MIGWGRDAMTSHPLVPEEGGRRVLAKQEDEQDLSANGRDGDHVPTLYVVTRSRPYLKAGDQLKGRPETG